MSLNRLISPYKLARIQPLRLFTTSSVVFGPNDDLQRIAEQRERAQSKESNRRADLRKMAVKRAAARANPERSPFYADIETALRYLRASEVGRPPTEAVITITTGVVSQKGAAKLAGSVSFPKPLKETKILVFTADEEQARLSKEAGAALVGGSELITQIKEGTLDLDFDRAFATPDISNQLGSIARIIGPKGLMPVAKKGTVSEDVAGLIRKLSGTLPFRQVAPNSVSIAVGRANFTDNEIVKNIVAAQAAFTQAILDQKSKKPTILGHTVLTSTHGPGFVINIK